MTSTSWSGPWSWSWSCPKSLLGGDEGLSNALCECYMFAAGWVLVHPASFRRPALDANTSSTLFSSCCMRRNSSWVFCLGQRLVIGTSGGCVVPPPPRPPSISAVVRGLQKPSCS